MTTDPLALAVARHFDEDAFLCEFAGVVSANLPSLDLVIISPALPAPTDTAPKINEPLTCPTCGGEGWFVTADPNKYGEPGEPYQVSCSNAIFHERDATLPAPTDTALREAAQAYIDAVDADMDRPGTSADAERRDDTLAALRAALKKTER
jgi:hypothetical protein